MLTLSRRLPDGSTEPRMPWPTIRAVASDDELKLMFAYRHNLQPVAGPAQ